MSEELRQARAPRQREPGASPRVRRTVAVPLVAFVALLGCFLLLAVSAYYPFDWDPPRMVRNDVTRSADGSLRFGELNAARTPGTPAWLHDVRTSGIVQIHLECNPQLLQKQAPASIMMLASDFGHTDFAIEQSHSYLVVWLRRPGSTDNGDPAFAVEGVLQPQRWTSVDVMLRRGDMRIDVDGTTRITERLPADSLRVWSAGQIVLGDEVHGGGPWAGEIRHAEVHTSGYAVDYVHPGALSIPKRYLYFPEHIAPLMPSSLEEWLILCLHLLSFIPVGVVIVWARRPPLHPVAATLLATGLAVVLAAGKFLFHGRHMAVADIVVQTVGALLGALLAWWLAHHRQALHPPDASHTTETAA